MMAGLTIFLLESGKEPRENVLHLSQDTMDEASRQLPQGVYSTFRTYDGATRVLNLRAHLARLYNPAADLGIQTSVSEMELRQNLKKLLEVFHSVEARVRVSLSLSENPGEVIVLLEQLKLSNETIYKNGVDAVISRAERTTPRLKSTSFIQNSALERDNNLKSGVYEALMVRNGRILEGLSSNFYAVSGEKINTARNDILLGVTRRIILRLSRRAGLTLEFKPLSVDELTSIDEAFITSSSRGVVPVVRVDGRPVGKGQPGEVARLLRRAYDNYVLEKAEKI